MAYWNRYSTEKASVGGGVPVWYVHPLRKQGGGRLTNPIGDMEKIAMGSPQEYNYMTHESTVLKCWKILTATVSATDTVIELKKAYNTPELKVGMFIMVCPTTITGTGKAVQVGAVAVNAEGNYEITVVTANIDALVIGKYIIESSATAAGASKSPMCVPNNFVMEDILGGDYNAVGCPAGIKHIYRNTIPDAPDAAFEKIQMVEWELFAELV